MSDTMEITVNGHVHKVSAGGSTPLLYVLRNEMGLNGPQFGCGLGQCGACTVIVDDEAVRSCNLPVSRVAGKNVITLEGIGSGDRLHPVQAAFLDLQAAQCGYCSNGMIMTSVALLNRTPHPDDAEIRAALDENLCRCGSHSRILRAVSRAAARNGRAPEER
jgi:nicotinate dehydrogenase subunit A